VAIASTYKQVAQAQVLKPVVDFLNFSFFWKKNVCCCPGSWINSPCLHAIENAVTFECWKIASTIEFGAAMMFQGLPHVTFVPTDNFTPSNVKKMMKSGYVFHLKEQIFCLFLSNFNIYNVKISWYQALFLSGYISIDY
jgi:hypothetical protein